VRNKERLQTIRELKCVEVDFHVFDLRNLKFIEREQAYGRVARHLLVPDGIYQQDGQLQCWMILPKRHAEGGRIFKMRSRYDCAKAFVRHGRQQVS
jgi:hypothetical protein